MKKVTYHGIRTWTCFVVVVVFVAAIMLFAGLLGLQFGKLSAVIFGWGPRRRTLQAGLLVPAPLAGGSSVSDERYTEEQAFEGVRKRFSRAMTPLSTELPRKSSMRWPRRSPTRNRTTGLGLGRRKSVAKLHASSMSPATGTSSTPTPATSAGEGEP